MTKNRSLYEVTQLNSDAKGQKKNSYKCVSNTYSILLRVVAIIKTWVIHLKKEHKTVFLFLDDTLVHLP